MKKLPPLPVEALRPSARAEDFSFTSTDELEPVVNLIGQERAVRAIGFGSRIEREGFNMFLSGPQGAGRHYAVSSLLRGKAAQEPPPDDWVYVNNFDEPHKPVALQLPAGTAVSFQNAMGSLISDLVAVFPALFEAEEYRARRGEIEEEAARQQEAAFEDLKERAARENITILRTPMGFMLTPVHDGKVLKPEDFEKLGAEEKKAIESKIKSLQGDLEKALERLPEIEKRRRDGLRNLHGGMAEAAVDKLMSTLRDKFGKIEPVARHLERVKADLIANADAFFKPEEQTPKGDSPAVPVSGVGTGGDARFRRYGVNVMVCSRGDDCNGHDGDALGAPLVVEDLPSLSNLVGRIEQIAHMGSLITDFMLIKPGALHRANGGYLVVDARRVINEPLAWDALKRCLANRHIKITSVSERYGMASTVTLEPDPIPLRVKVVLVGDRGLYYLLMRHDPDFPELFKVQADFDEEISRTKENNALYARLIATTAKREKLLPLGADAVARTIDEAARMADDNEKLLLRVGMLSDLLSEANYFALESGRDKIAAADVEEACRQRLDRASRIRERSHERIIRNTMLVATQGEEVGQINGLSVLTIGGFSFGQPARITAQVRMGAGKVVDIEREVQLGGPLHSKGVLILSSFLAAHYALDVPMSLWASLVFEQSYGLIDGDSASSTELYALLSALSRVPISQSFAVTGSVNQKGEIQAIGGVNEKVEGFFDICRERGLTGKQGVLVPQSNVKNLMLRPDVVKAAEDGDFRIYGVSHIHEGIALLTGLPAGERDGDGNFPEGSVNAMVEDRLREFAYARREFSSRKKEKNNDSETEGEGK
ncbi:MAG: AAA family ATPase [Hyphomicrobiales bacterium]|nr:AAA family ATPase [Hyphomicrobiales bacterium]